MLKKRIIESHMKWKHRFDNLALEFVYLVCLFFNRVIYDLEIFARFSKCSFVKISDINVCNYSINLKINNVFVRSVNKMLMKLPCCDFFLFYRKSVRFPKGRHGKDAAFTSAGGYGLSGATSLLYFIETLHTQKPEPEPNHLKKLVYCACK